MPITGLVSRVLAEKINNNNIQPCLLCAIVEMEFSK